MNKEELNTKLSYFRNQFEIAKMYAMYWQAMAVTGVATLRDVLLLRCSFLMVQNNLKDYPALKLQ